MVDFRTIKERARRDLHSRMQIPAYYRASAADEWIPVHVRLHRRSTKIGDFPGLEGATMVDASPKILFMLDEVAEPRRGGFVSLAEGEAYRLGESDVPDGLSISVNAAPMPAAQTTGFPVP